MKIDTKVTLGGVEYNFHVDEQSTKEALHKAIVLGNPRQYCAVCENKQYFQFISNKDKEGNTYVNVLCKKCGAKSKLGEYKVGGFFWRNFEQYQANADEPNNTKKDFFGE